MRTPAALTLLVVCSACATTTMQVGSDYDHAAPFASYHTYTLMQRPHRDRAEAANPLVAVRVRDAIEAELNRKGYTMAPEGTAADFAVDYTIGSRERTDIQAYPTPFSGPWFGPGPWWGGPYWGDSVDVRQIREGTLSIDVFDVMSHRPVWHGWARKELTRSDIERSQEPIRRAVTSVLDKFPPGSAGSTS